MGYRTGSNEDSAETSASCIAGSSFEWAFRDSNASTKQPEHHVRISAASLGAKQMSQCSSGLPSNSCSSSTRHVPSQDSGHAHHSTVPAFLTDARAFKEAVRALQGVPCADTDCEAPTSDLQQSPQAPHICLGASKTPKTLRSSDLMRRGPRVRAPGHCWTERLRCVALVYPLRSSAGLDEHHSNYMTLICVYRLPILHYSLRIAILL